MKKLEAKFQSKFNNWLVDQDFPTSVFELKYVRTTNFRLADIKPHQLLNLKLAQEKRIIYKIPDSGFEQKPFDSFIIKNAMSFIVVMWHRRGNKTFYMIPINAISHQINLGVRSLDEGICALLGYKYTLKN